jgi:hypothetical protein
MEEKNEKGIEGNLSEEQSREKKNVLHLPGTDRNSSVL